MLIGFLMLFSGHFLFYLSFHVFQLPKILAALFWFYIFQTSIILYNFFTTVAVRNSIVEFRSMVLIVLETIYVIFCVLPYSLTFQPPPVDEDEIVWSTERLKMYFFLLAYLPYLSASSRYIAAKKSTPPNDLNRE